MLPKWITDADRKAYFEYLDELRESGETNMFAARPYLQDMFPELENKRDAGAVLKEWMDAFAERHPKEGED